MKKKHYTLFFTKIFIAGLMLINTTVSFAQSKNTDSSFQKKIKLTTVIIADYSMSLDKYTDVQSGVHNIKTDSGVVTNSFNFKYIRVQGNYDLTPNIDANILVNFAELKNANADFHKVIEMAYMRYKFFNNGYLNLQVGQFRPYTQLEDLYGIQFHKSNYWSNQYSGLGSSNWTSFQVGAALTGSLKKKNIPLNYYLTVWNGNGRTSTTVNSLAQTNGDNDNNKNIALRLEYEPLKDIILGISQATTKYQGKGVQSFSADIRAKQKFNKKWEGELEASYTSADDVSAIIAATGTTIPASKLDFGNYKMRGFYAIPLLRYNNGTSRIKSTELSCRYEYWNQDVSADNPRTTISPMLNFNLAENYGARVQVIGVFNSYKTQVTNANSSVYNANQIILQVQFFF
jgi:hypothetical protein